MAFYFDLKLHQCSHKTEQAARQGQAGSGHLAETPQIPPPNIFDVDVSSATTPTDAPALPKLQECAIHLELLQSIYHFRENVQSSSSIQFIGQAADEGGQHQEVRSYRWSVFLRLAVLRFLRWLDVGVMLPPLDILMVWQACLLNPVYFTRLCARRGCERLRSTPFPWKEVHTAMAPGDGTFHLTEEMQAAFERESKLAPDLLLLLTSGDGARIFEHISSWLPSTVTTSVTVPVQANLPIGNVVTVLLNRCIKVCDCEQVVTDIAAAVDRQYSFVEKMEQHMWLRSPAVHGTLRRAVSRYEKFIQLLKRYPDSFLVPTLDIDLVWHTHQCAGARYQADMVKLTGSFVDHDDKAGPPALKGGERMTQQLFRLHFESEYLCCLCWNCEAILSELEEVKRSGQKMDRERRKDLARRVAALVLYHKAAELARQTGAQIGGENSAT